MEAELGGSGVGTLPGLLEAKALLLSKDHTAFLPGVSSWRTRCSGRMQKDAICEGNLFLESRDSRWWSQPTPNSSEGM